MNIERYEKPFKVFYKTKETKDIKLECIRGYILKSSNVAETVNFELPNGDIIEFNLNEILKFSEEVRLQGKVL